MSGLWTCQNKDLQETHEPQTLDNKSVHVSNLRRSRSPFYRFVEWLILPAEDRAMILYRHPDFQILDQAKLAELPTEGNMRRVERGLRRILDCGWVTFESFMQGFHQGLGGKDGTILAKKGRSWEYQIPEYDETERLFIEKVIFERLCQVGLVRTGKYRGEPCFCLTDFGKQTLGK